MTGNNDKPAADPNKIDAVKLSMMLNELRLPTINQLWQSFAKRADAEGWTAARFLAALVEHELAERGRRRIQRHLGEARLLPGKSLASFDFNAVPTISKAQVSALAAGDAWLSSAVSGTTPAPQTPRHEPGRSTEAQRPQAPERMPELKFAAPESPPLPVSKSAARRATDTTGKMERAAPSEP